MVTVMVILMIMAKFMTQVWTRVIMYTMRSARKQKLCFRGALRIGVNLALFQTPVSYFYLYFSGGPRNAHFPIAYLPIPTLLHLHLHVQCLLLQLEVGLPILIFLRGDRFQMLMGLGIGVHVLLVDVYLLVYWGCTIFLPIPHCPRLLGSLLLCLYFISFVVEGWPQHPRRYLGIKIQLINSSPIYYYIISYHYRVQLINNFPNLQTDTLFFAHKIHLITMDPEHNFRLIM